MSKLQRYGLTLMLFGIVGVLYTQNLTDPKIPIWIFFILILVGAPMFEAEL